MPKYIALRDSATGQKLQVFTLGGKETATPRDMPGSVNIRGQHFEVRYHTKIYAKHRANSKLRGIVMYEPRVIVLDPDQSIHFMRETLYHEMAHVYLMVKQMQSAALAALDAEQTEELCDLFAEAYYDALLNGPKL